MYLSLAILMGTTWLRLSYTQENIQNFLMALFFGSAFMSFMVTHASQKNLILRLLHTFQHFWKTELS